MMRCFTLGCLGVAVWQTAASQAMRDPMQMPVMRAPSAQAEVPHDHTASQTAEMVPRWDGPVSVLRIEGQPRLVVGTRLMAVGQTLGPERIERITETEVWLSQGTQQRRITLFEGIRRSTSPAATSHHTPGAPP